MQQHRVETQILHEEQILEAIDQLRRRKARPDADRICNYLLRKFSVDARDTIADLHRLIEAEKVIQVDYKGNTSYRNASKWSRLQLYKNRPEGFVKEKLNSGMVAGAVAELVVEEPDYLDQGVPAYRLVEQLLDGVSNPTSRRMVEDFLGKEVASGNLTRLSNGNYSLVATSDMTTTAEPTHRESFTLENGNARRKELHTVSSTTGGLYDFDETENLTITDSRSNTPRSSRQASPKPDPQIRKEECFEIIVGRNENTESSVEHDSLKEQESQEPSQTSVEDGKEESKTTDSQSHNLKRSSKAERKQRLLVRTDDPMDIEIKFEDYRKDNKEETNSQKEKRDETGHLSEEREDDDAGRSSTNPSPTPSSVNVGGFRSARRKRAKKVFDPSDNNLVKRKRGRQPGSQNKSTLSQESQDTVKPTVKDGPCRQCSLCAKEKQESLVACRDCTVRAHPSCIYSPEEMLQKGPLATCFTCDEAYHYYCHTPRIILPKSNSKWQCNDCVQKQYKPSINQNISLVTSRPDTPSNPPVLPPVLSPQVSPARGSSDQMEDDGPRDGIDPNIPDASDWTSEQVYQYFARLFPKEAEVFRQQDIDGHSLLLMKRSDVLSGLDLLLGPALKIYRHVLKLQVRRDDPKLYWL
ncbi:L(3)mbt interactor in ovarian somatic cells isoform X2 [Halictus rubicundus]|uniref:L(3)mbt interactor in ovarian somatic cells isoform X2 n=1 Tax=Halictus rubicundus TaxID=77578 RepID=UPI004036135D